MKSFRRLGWSNTRVAACLITLGIALFTGATVQAAPQYDLNCSDCHHMPPLDSANGTRDPYTGAVKGNHQSHAGATAVSCAKCHGSSVETYMSSHRDKKIPMQANINSSPAPAGGTYSRPSFFNQTSVPPTPLGTCSNVNCHFEKTSPSWGSANFGAPSETNCSLCHSAKPITGSHTNHITSYGNSLTTCSLCHNDHTADPATPYQHAHAVGSPLYIKPQHRYSGSNNNFLPSQSDSRVYGLCSAATCHSNPYSSGSGASPTWGSSGGCISCHNAGGAFTDDGAPATGSHARHLALNNVLCEQCHTGAIKNSSGGVTHANGTVEVTSGYTASPVAKHTAGTYTGTCSTSCHSDGNGTRVTTPLWGVTMPADCTGCHGGAATVTPTYGVINTGKHSSHMNNYSTLGRSNNFMCAECHAKTVSMTSNTVITTRGNHLNSFKDYSGVKAGGSDSYATATGVCSNVYCHSSGREINVFRTMTGSKTWRGTARFDCNGCHGSEAGASWNNSFGAPNYDNGIPAANSHKKHTVDAGLTDSRGCAICHATTVDRNVANKLRDYSSAHLNKTRDIAFQTSGNYTAETKTCSSIYCHSNGQSTPGTIFATASWGATLNCTSCHDTKKTSATATTLSGKHDRHMNSNSNVMIGAGNGLNCVDCHARTVSDNSTLSDATRHSNGFIEYSGLKTGNFNATTKQCSNVYCHSNGSNGTLIYVNPPAWTSDSALGCNGCHGTTTINGAPDYISASGTPNSHSAHVAGQETTICAKCHASTADGTTASQLTASGTHINKNVEVNFNSANLTAAWTSGTKSCSSVTCHSDGRGNFITPTWGGSLPSSDCGACHPLINLSTGHSYHITATQAPLSYSNLTSNRSTASNYNFGCANCHPLSNIDHRNGTVAIDMRPTNQVSTLRSKNSDLITSAGAPGAAGTGTTVTTGASRTLTCANIYCHSNGWSNGTITYASTPDWYTGYTGADRCAMCHGNSPDTSIPGSPAHAIHVVGIHALNVSDRFGNLKTGASGNVGHGVAYQSTTLNCNVCHADTVTSGRNDKNTACIFCHNNQGNSTVIVNRSLHVDGTVNISFMDAKVVSKAQLRPASFAAYSGKIWTRNLGIYKNSSSAFDTSKLTLRGSATYDGSGGCSNVSCHMGQTVKWDDKPISYCSICHTSL